MYEQLKERFEGKPALNFEVSEKKAKTVCNERDICGRFKQKYKTGERTANGHIIKQVIEDDWKLLQEKDKNGNSYYLCLKC